MIIYIILDTVSTNEVRPIFPGPLDPAGSAAFLASSNTSFLIVSSLEEIGRYEMMRTNQQ